MKKQVRGNLLWYQAPAACWEEALPLGSGRLGMMVYGGTNREILQLNEETLWSGRPYQWDNPACREQLPRIRELLFRRQYRQAQELCREYLVCRGKGCEDEGYGSYQTAGELVLESPAPDTTGYTRQLDLTTGIARTGFGPVARLHTASHQYQITASHITGTERCRLSFRREEGQIRYAPGEILVTGSNQALDYCTVIQVQSDGVCEADHQGLTLEGCTYFTILTCTATSYQGEAPEPVCRERLAQGWQAGFCRILDSQRQWISQAMGRCRLTLPADPDAADLPTDQRLARVASGRTDPDLLRLYFDYGKYLMICSGWGTLPANLQGIWANSLLTPWNGDYHININLQMNYWFVDAVDLPEYGQPLYRYLTFLARHGQKTASSMYGCRGWVAHTLTNPWGYTAPGQDPLWGAFHTAAAWCCRHLYEHYLYTGDRDFLEAYWPMVRDCALFYLDFLTEDPETGFLVPAPSSSPENQFLDPASGQRVSICPAAAMDCQILRDLFRFTLAWAEELKIRDEVTDRLPEYLRRLPPTVVSPRYGTIQEWNEDFEEAEPGHRHISQLYALYPAAEINAGTPELMEAAAKALQRRLSYGGGHTGWSRAWIINFYARLLDGQAVEHHLQALLQKSTLPNLFDNHPPFQIDGNFGAPAGMLEALVQSHEGFLRLLPALPPSWDHGRLEGVRVRGNMALSFAWENGRVVSGAIRAAADRQVTILVNGQRLTLDLKKDVPTPIPCES